MSKSSRTYGRRPRSSGRRPVEPVDSEPRQDEETTPSRRRAADEPPDDPPTRGERTRPEPRQGSPRGRAKGDAENGRARRPKPRAERKPRHAKRNGRRPDAAPRDDAGARRPRSGSRERPRQTNRDDARPTRRSDTRRARGGDTRQPRSSDTRQSRGGETRSRGGDARSRGGDTRARGGDTRARGGETRPRGGDARSRGSESRARSGPPQRHDSTERGRRRDTRRRAPEGRRGRSHESAKQAAPRTATGVATGVLELADRGTGYLRQLERMYRPEPTDVFVSAALIRNHRLKQGLTIHGPIGAGRGGRDELIEVETINGRPAEDYRSIRNLQDLTPIDPLERLRFATGKEPLTTRVVDLISPVGKGQRALIVAPPRTGKTILLQHMAHGIADNHPEALVKMLLVDERPEEVTEMKRSIRGEVVASSSDMNSDAHVRIAELVLEQARREVEYGHDVVLFLDSLTRLGRAYNREVGNSGRTLTGGVDARALERPKRIFGAARNIQDGGSLTIIATALIDTGSRMDEVIFQEFKGTGNMELVLNREIADRRIYPAVDIGTSATRKEEKLYTPEELKRAHLLRRRIAGMEPLSAIQEVLNHLDVWEGKTGDI